MSIEGLLAAKGVSHAQLADRLGVSEGRVLQWLAGEADLTVRSLAMLAEGLDAQVEISIRPREIEPGGSGSAGRARRRMHGRAGEWQGSVAARH
ncbi:helix-turn-helix domain-containing protein [Actinacidiphila rubida]|uniref:Helix-turn-helix n=1 Tax=Actinacidiphila rubida TaxID=310780 RepID=A0A1H8K9F0_9ACTN|nr:helix-turn-helix transcriptional regulator [Actinacidiphila rubida]SEN89544.1 Helix-turn-helix [Actinacidiphila rubida]